MKKEITLIPRIAVVVTTRCTLKCKKCAGLFPYFTEKRNFSFEDIISGIKFIEQNAKKIFCLEFVGGEPFLHPDLDILLKYAKESEKIGMIEITTNAVVNISPKVLKELRSSKILVMISDYGFNRENVTGLVKIFRQMAVNYKILNQKQWIEFGEPRDYGRTVREMEKKYMNCFAAGLCLVLYNGKIMYCGRGPFLYEGGVLKKQYIDVTDYCFSPKWFYRFYIDIRYNYCNYCNFKNRIIMGGEQIKDKE